MIVNLKATSDELEELNVMFEKFDTNHDGEISMDELKVGMKEIMDPWNYDNADWQSYFDAIDVDKDGKLSYAEFTTAAFSRARMLTDKNIDAVFAVFDTNNDGHIGVDELKEVFHGHLDDVKGSGIESKSMLSTSIS